MLTLWTVAGLGVAALHRGWFRVGVALVHRVQVPLLVWADHLALSGARGTALGALQEKRHRNPPMRLFFSNRGHSSQILWKIHSFISVCLQVCIPLTSPHSPTCQWICFGQVDISQGWTADGRSRVLQDDSSSIIPADPTQVTSLVCSPEPQVTEHCKHPD